MRRQSPDGFVSAKVTETAGPRLEKNTIQEVSAFPLASFVRFTEGSGYTQLSGDWTTVLSEYHITKALYDIREDKDWPVLDDRTVVVTPANDEPPPVGGKFIDKKVPIPKPTDVPEAFEDDLEKRLDAAANTMLAKPARKEKTS